MEAAGVEPDISAENAELTDSVNARKEQNAMFAKSAYKLFLEFPERQQLYLPIRSAGESEVFLPHLYISSGSRRFDVYAPGRRAERRVSDRFAGANGLKFYHSYRTIASIRAAKPAQR